MDVRNFDDLTKVIAAAPSRRQALRLFGASVLGALVGSLRPPEAVAQNGPGGSICVNQGQSCTAQKCCQGLSCLQDATSSSAKFCCPTGTEACGGICRTPCAPKTKRNKKTCACEGEQCPTGTTLVNGVCAHLCSAATDCPSTCVCEGRGADPFTGICGTNRPTGQLCSSDLDCPAGTVCSGSIFTPNRVCAPVCANDSTCPPGQACVQSFASAPHCSPICSF